VTELGGGVDPFQVDLLESSTLGVGDERFAEGEDPLLGSDAAALEHHKVVLDFAVVGEATHWSDGFIGEISLSGSVVLDKFTAVLVDSLTDSVDLLVDLGTMMVTFLTRSSDRVGDSGRMPRTDASDLPETLVRLTGKLLGVPTGGDTFLSLSFVDSDDVDHFVFSEDSVYIDRFFEHGPGVIHLITDTSSIHLNLHDVGLLRAQWQKLHLGMSDNTDDFAVLLHLLEIAFDLLLAVLILPFAASFAEGLLLGFVPVLVESSLALLADMFSKDGLESTEASWSLDVPDGADHDHGRRLKNGDGVNHLLLVGF